MNEHIPDWKLRELRHVDCPQDEYGDDVLHVGCDELECWALRDPQTVDQLREALEHWQNHGWLNGCSHGC